MRFCCKMIVYLLLSIWPLSLSAQVGKNSQGQNSEKVSIYGVLENGSGTKWRTFPILELIHLQKGMQSVEKIHPTKNHFRFSPITEPTAPYLIRAVYQGASYAHLIPPKRQYWQKKQTVVVYDSGASLEDIEIISIMEVTKIRSSLLVKKTYSFRNNSKPPKSFSLRNILFFVPSDAKELVAGLRYARGNVRIPLKPIQKGKNYYFVRSLRPGHSELSVSYRFPRMDLPDYFLSFLEVTSQIKTIRTLIWAPKDLIPRIKGAKSKLIQIPRIGSAYQVYYEPKKAVMYNFENGGFIVQNPLESDSNPFYDSDGKTLFAVAVVFLNIFGIIAFLHKRL